MKIRPEGAEGSAGLAHYDFVKKEVRIYPITDLIRVIRPVEESLFIGTSDGIYLLDEKREWKRIRFDLDINGRYQVAMTALDLKAKVFLHATEQD